MRTTRRLATLVLAASAGLSLAACSTTIEAKPVAATQSASVQPAAPPMEEAADTATADAGTGSGTSPAGTSTDAGTGSSTGTGTSTGTEEIPEPGAGIPGDAGLCQAVAGWYGYVGLSLLAVDDSGAVDPADVIPLLEALRDAPEGHQDAGATVVDAAGNVSDAADRVIGELESGTDAYTAIGILDQPITDFATACSSAGVDDF